MVTATVSLPNWGQPATAVRLYEAWAPSAPDLSPGAGPGDLRVPLPNRPGPLTDDLRRSLDAAADGQATIIVYLREQADLSSAAALRDWNARGAAVHQALTSHANRTQQPLLGKLRAAGRRPRSYWIVNALAVHGDRALADWLAAQLEVGLVDANHVHVVDAPGATPAASASVAWGVAQIDAPRAWADWDVRGTGIVVANIDSGVAFTHTALLTAYRGWSPSGVTHDYHWYDAITTTLPHQPSDPVGHGTHTMGTIVGGIGSQAMAIGVAPGARWIAARACGGLFCDDEALLAAAQWMLAPTDSQFANPRPDLRPHIISNAWGQPGDDPWYLGYVEAWNGAGIFSVFANGNEGWLFGCGANSTPGNYAAAFAVGATDREDFIADFSSRGPTSDGRVKPDVSAPGVDVPSACPDGGLVLRSGTSMATPHVAGLAALLWSANPALIGDIAATRQIIQSTARPRWSPECGDAPGARPNNVYGWGRVDAWQAVLAARVDVPWLSVPPTADLPANDLGAVVAMLDARRVDAPGQYAARILVARNNALVPIPVTFDVQPAPNTVRLSGRLVDRWTGAGVYGRISLGQGPEVRADSSGSYTMTLPAAAYGITATAIGYVPELISVNLVTDTVRDITLTADLPHLRVNAPPLSVTLPFGGRHDTALVLNNDGLQPLTVTVSVPPLEWSVAEISGTTLYDLTSFALLPLGDDEVYTNALELGFSVPMYGAWVDRLYLSSNGWASAARPGSALPSATCTLGESLPAGALAPFWTDLDPSVGGAVRAGRVASDTFVISFEDVPPWRQNPQPGDPTYTFQLAVHADGRVQYLYGAMGSRPARWAVGVSQSAARSQTIACYRSPQALPGRGWTLLNQTSPTVWLSAWPADLNILPGESASLTATLRGFGYLAWRSEPFAGVLRLATNDPLVRQLDLPAQLIVSTPPPYNLWLPWIGR